MRVSLVERRPALIETALARQGEGADPTCGQGRFGMRKIEAAIVALLLLGCSNPGAAQGDAAGAVLLVGNKGEDTVSFVDLASGRELGRSPTGKWPHEIAVSPDGRQAAVVSYGAAAVDLFD